MLTLKLMDSIIVVANSNIIVILVLIIPTLSP